jgi:NitT/TauT family transport system substrate-binding protein
MVAYVRGLRDYNDAFGPKRRNRADIVAILTKNTNVKDAALYDKMALQALHPNGTLNVDSLLQQQEFFLADGTQQARVDIRQFVDTRFIEEAARQLGPYS